MYMVCRAFSVQYFLISPIKRGRHCKRWNGGIATVSLPLLDPCQCFSAGLIMASHDVPSVGAMIYIGVKPLIKSVASLYSVVDTQHLAYRVPQIRNTGFVWLHFRLQRPLSLGSFKGRKPAYHQCVSLRVYKFKPPLPATDRQRSLIPSLLFANVIKSIDTSNVSALGPITLVGALYQILGLGLAWLVRLTFPVPKNFRNGVSECPSSRPYTVFQLMQYNQLLVAGLLGNWVRRSLVMLSNRSKLKQSHTLRVICRLPSSKPLPQPPLLIRPQIRRLLRLTQVYTS